MERSARREAASGARLSPTHALQPGLGARDRRTQLIECWQEDLIAISLREEDARLLDAWSARLAHLLAQPFRPLPRREQLGMDRASHLLRPHGTCEAMGIGVELLEILELRRPIDGFFRLPEPRLLRLLFGKQRHLGHVELVRPRLLH